MSDTYHNEPNLDFGPCLYFGSMTNASMCDEPNHHVLLAIKGVLEIRECKYYSVANE